VRDLSEIERVIDGQAIATLAELQALSYEVPEDKVLPAVLTRFTSGAEVAPGELYRALDGEARDAVGDSDAGQELLEMLLRRLRAAFPAQTA